MTLEDRVQTALTAIKEIVPAPLLHDGEDNIRGVLGDLLGYTDGSFTRRAPWHRRNRHGDKCISCQRAWPCVKASMVAAPPSALREGEELVEIDEAGDIVRRGAVHPGGAA